MRVLIVEDEPVIVLDLMDILEDAGHIVVGVAESMERALELATASVPFDVAIMDVDLSGGPDGVETARRLREQHDVPSLFVSGRLTDESRALAAEWGPLGFIGKPFLPEQVLGAIGGSS